MPILLQLQKLPWKGDGRCKKSVFASFFCFFCAAQKIASSLKKKKKKKKKSVLGHPI